MPPERPPFHSILDQRPRDVDAEAADPSALFADLRLDQIGESLLAGRREHNLMPFFLAPLHDQGSVRYRHEVLRDLANTDVADCIRSFAEQMVRVQGHLAGINKLGYRYYKEGWFLDAAEIYCAAVSALFDGLASLPIASRGFEALREYLANYVRSAAFTSLTTEAQQVRRALEGVTYCLNIRGNRVTVTKYAEQLEYSVEVEETFAKFKQGAVKDYRVKLPDHRDTNHVQARVLMILARLYPDVFAALDAYRASHNDFVDATVQAFHREVQFYLAYLEYIEPLKQAGLAFCFPEVSEHSKTIHAQGAFDLALAKKLVPEGSAVVTNDFVLTDRDRVLVVTGPNQGGKTTFARTFGQLHYLASLGLPVPGERAQLFLPDRIFTHFEKEEDLATLRGKLEDELVRVHDILQQATEHSILIMNESFTSTTLADALFIGTEVLRRVIEIDPLCVYVTFVDELASLSATTVSMVATVLPDNPATRTYKVVRKPADGRAYAAALAEKYGLTSESLRERVAR